MSWLFPNVVYQSSATKPKYKPAIWIADGIRRCVDDQTLEPGTRFMTEDDYTKMMSASETVAVALADHNYRAGKWEGVLIGAALVGGALTLVGIVLMMTC
jgi:hypothetical protein